MKALLLLLAVVACMYAPVLAQPAGAHLVTVDTLDASESELFFVHDSIYTAGSGIAVPTGYRLVNVHFYNDTSSTGRLWIALENDTTNAFYIRPGETWSEDASTAKFVRCKPDSGATVVRQVNVRLR